MENLFERATKNRAVAETHCNSRSSRSHSVFTLKISGKNEVTSETCVGKQEFRPHSNSFYVALRAGLYPSTWCNAGAEMGLLFTKNLEDGVQNVHETDKNRL